jgi:gluconate 2-dehydrogenase gamma chain
MTQENEPRRKFLRQMFTLVPASVLAPAIVAEASCTESSPSAPGTIDKNGAVANYVPTYFTQAEWDFVCAAVDQLIPSDQYGAGGLEAGVPEFIDRQMETAYGQGKLWYMQGPFHPEVAPELGYQMSMAPRDIYRHGIEACNAWCVKQHDKAFGALDAPTRVHVLELLEGGKVELNGVPGKLFFNTMLTNTKEGYWSDPMYGGNKDMSGWKMIGFPGARADFADWIDQPGAKYPLGPVSILGEQS